MGHLRSCRGGHIIHRLHNYRQQQGPRSAAAWASMQPERSADPRVPRGGMSTPRSAFDAFKGHSFSLHLPLCGKEESFGKGESP